MKKIQQKLYTNKKIFISSLVVMFAVGIITATVSAQGTITSQRIFNGGFGAGTQQLLSRVGSLTIGSLLTSPWILNTVNFNCNHGTNIGDKTCLSVNDGAVFGELLSHNPIHVGTQAIITNLANVTSPNPNIGTFFVQDNNNPFINDSSVLVHELARFDGLNGTFNPQDTTTKRNVCANADGRLNICNTLGYDWDIGPWSACAVDTPSSCQNIAPGTCAVPRTGSCMVNVNNVSGNTVAPNNEPTYEFADVHCRGFTTQSTCDSATGTIVSGGMALTNRSICAWSPDVGNLRVHTIDDYRTYSNANNLGAAPVQNLTFPINEYTENLFRGLDDQNSPFPADLLIRRDMQNTCHVSGKDPNNPTVGPSGSRIAEYVAVMFFDPINLPPSTSADYQNPTPLYNIRVRLTDTPDHLGWTTSNTVSGTSFELLSITEFNGRTHSGSLWGTINTGPPSNPNTITIPGNRTRDCSVVSDAIPCQGDILCQWTPSSNSQTRTVNCEDQDGDSASNWLCPLPEPPAIQYCLMANEG